GGEFGVGSQHFASIALEGFLGQFAFCYVTDSTRNQNAFLCFKRTQADFDGEFRSVFPAAVEFESGAHGPHAILLAVLISVPRVPSLETSRDQNFHLPADQFLARITEELFRLRIYELDPAGTIDNDDGIRRRFEQVAE